MAEVKTILITLALFLISQQTNANELAECRVYNAKQFAYIYAKYKLLGSERQVLPYRSFKDDFKYLFGKEIKIEYNGKDRSGVWIFEPVRGRKNTFYLRNKKYTDEYFKGSDSYQEWIFKENRSAWAAKKEDLVDDEYYMWKFEPISNTDRYHISNVKLKADMYTRVYNGGKHKKMIISLFDGFKTDPKEFEWILKCKDDLLPLISE